jgi:hypothetical protein
MQYRKGLVSVENGSNIVTGDAATLWASRVGTQAPGALFGIPNQVGTYYVQEINEDGNLVLTSDWAGDTLDDVSYWLTLDFTPILGLPTPQPFDLDATKVIEKAFIMLDSMMDLKPIGIYSAKSATVTAPPGSPSDGDTYIVPTGATGAWSGYATKIAVYRRGAWLFYTPSNAMFLKVVDAGAFYFFNAGTSAWEENPILGDGRAVAAREDAPTDNAIPYWDAASSTFKTAGSYTLSGLQGQFTTIQGQFTDHQTKLDNRVRVDAAQAFSSGQKTQARANIGAVIGTDVQAHAVRLDTIVATGITTDMIATGKFSTDGTFAGNADDVLVSQKAIKTYIGTAIADYVAAQDIERFKGGIDCSTNPNFPAADAGFVYRVTVAGKIGGASGINVEVNDRLECVVDGTASGTSAAVGANWMISQVNIDGAVTGPTSAASGNLATFNGASGKIIQDSGVAANSVVVGPASAATGNIASYNGTTGKLIQDGGIAVSNIATLSGAQTFSGAKTFSTAITYGGVTLANSVTGTGSMVLSINPTTTGNSNISGVTCISGQITLGNNLSYQVKDTGGNTRNFVYLDNGNEWRIGDPSINSGFHFSNSIGGVDCFVVNASGNVGIKMTPAFALDVNGTIRASAAAGDGIEIASIGSNTCRVVAYNRSTSAYKTLLFDGAAHQFNVNGTEIGDITSTGFVHKGDSTYFRFTNSAGTEVVRMGTYKAWVGSGSVTDFSIGGLGTVKIHTNNNNAATLDLDGASVTLGRTPRIFGNGSVLQLGSNGNVYVTLDGGVAAMYPGNDNIFSLGYTGIRWTTVFATTGSINTSDIREKRFRNETGALNDNELDAGDVLLDKISAYQRLDAVEKKGENARFHIGLGAQWVRDTLTEHGVDAHSMAFLCYDKWDASPAVEEQEAVYNKKGKLIKERVNPKDAVEAGDRWGLRDNEMQYYLLAAEHRRVKRLEAANDELRAENAAMREDLDAIKKHLGLAA